MLLRVYSHYAHIVTYYSLMHAVDISKDKCVLRWRLCSRPRGSESFGLLIFSLALRSDFNYKCCLVWNIAECYRDVSSVSLFLDFHEVMQIPLRLIEHR